MDEPDWTMEHQMVIDVIDLIPDLTDGGLFLIAAAVENELQRRFAGVGEKSDKSKGGVTLWRVK